MTFEVSNRLFYYGLVFSFILHMIVIGVLSFMKSGEIRQASQRLEVMYHQTMKAAPAAAPKTDVQLDPKKPAVPREAVEILTKKANMPAGLLESETAMSKTHLPMSAQKSPAEIKTLEIERKVMVTPLDTDKITNPQYLSYEESLRKSIEKSIEKNLESRLYNHVDNPKFDSGKVYVTFVLLASGHLRDIQIRSDKTLANAYLQDISLRTVKEAGPFPPFPKGFNYPEFTFNIMIIYNKGDN